MQQNRITMIVGKTGCGKTYRAAKMFATRERALVFNVAFDEAYYSRATHIIRDDVLAAERVMFKEEKFRIVFETDIMREQRQNLYYPSLDPLLNVCYEVGDMLVVLDEAHQICTPYSASFMTRKLFRMGRHRNIDIIYITQRIQGSIHRDLSSTTHEVIFYRVTDTRDLDSIAKMCGDVVAKRVGELKPISEDHGIVVPGEIHTWTIEDAL